MRQRKQVKILSILSAMIMVLTCLTVVTMTTSASVTDVVLEDFEDAAHVAKWHQGVAGATMTQDTTVKHNGAASGLFANSSNNGLTGDGQNADVVGFDLSGFEKFRFYIKNPGPAVDLLFQLYLSNYQSTGSQPHVAIVSVPANTEFAAYDVVLADMVLKGTEQKMSAQAKEHWKILEYGVAVASPGTYTLYFDDITAVAPVSSSTTTTTESSQAATTTTTESSQAATTTTTESSQAATTTTTVATDPVEEGMKLLWDMEDESLIAQLVTDPNIQTTEQKQSLEFKRNGSASLYWKNSKGNYGALGNMVAFKDQDMTGFDAIRFYVYNPGDYPTMVQCQLAVKAFGNTAVYVAEAEVPASNGFIPLDFDLDAFERKPISTAGQEKLLDNQEADSLIIYDIGLVFNSRERDELYLDDAMLITDEYASRHANDTIVAVKPSQSSTTTTAGGGTTTTKVAGDADSSDGSDSSPQTGITFGVGALCLVLFASSLVCLSMLNRKKQY